MTEASAASMKPSIEASRGPEELTGAAEGPVVKCIDHLLIRVADPGPLLSVFSEIFGLPLAWREGSHGFYTNAGIFAGNVDLEIIRFGPPAAKAAPQPARIYGVVFEGHQPLASTLAELARRNIQCSGNIRFGAKLPEGSTVNPFNQRLLGGLLGGNIWTRLVFCITQLPVYGKINQVRSASSSAKGGSIDRFLLDRAFASGFVSMVEYEPQFRQRAEERRGKNHAELCSRAGGSLGILGLDEVVVGLKHLDDVELRWRRLLGSPNGQNFRLRQGPGIKLVSSDRDVLEALVFQVQSVAAAVEFLAERNMLGAYSNQEITIAASSLDGLQVRLRE